VSLIKKNIPHSNITDIVIDTISSIRVKANVRLSRDIYFMSLAMHIKKNNLDDKQYI